MRWFWIDRFVEFHSGSHARAIKNVTLAEDHLHDHFPGFPVMPGSLIIEGMAQTGGILLGEMTKFEAMVVLAKIPRVVFRSHVCPGDTVTYDVKLLDAREDGGVVDSRAHVGERLVAEAEIFFARLNRDDSQNISQECLLNMMQLLRVWDTHRADELDNAESSD